MAFKKKQGRTTTEEENENKEEQQQNQQPTEAVPPKVLNGTTSISFSKNDGLQTTTTTSSAGQFEEANKITDSVTSSNGRPSFVSSSYSTNPILATSSGSPSRATSLISGTDRINPFDKNPNAAGGVFAETSSVAVTAGAEAVKEESGTTLDDLIKTRFTKTQGILDEITGKYKPSLADTKMEQQSFEEMKNELFRRDEKKKPVLEPKKSDTDSVFSSSPSPRQPADINSQSAYGKFSRTLSSDAEIIFGGTGSTSGSNTAPAGHVARPKYNYSIESQSSYSSSDTDNIFARKDDNRSMSFTKSLSVSSTDDRDFSTDPRVIKPFEGIQNAAFQDFEPVVGPRPNASASPKWQPANDDYEDLK